MSIVYKHLQGRHNQKTHGNRYGAGSRLTSPISRRVEFYEAQDGIYGVMGYKKATAGQISEFKQSIDKLPPEIQGLMQGEYTPLVLAEYPSDYWGIQQGNWVALGAKAFEGGIARHEFIHYIVNGGKIGENLKQYSPSWKFDHAKSNPDARNKINEDLTMVLTDYSKNRNEWIKNVMANEVGITKEMANQKIDEVTEFLQGLGLW